MGKQQLSFSSSGCMYTAHDAYSMCDYCVPSACLRALLRLLSASASAARAAALEPTASSDAAAPASSKPSASKPSHRRGRSSFGSGAAAASRQASGAVAVVSAAALAAAAAAREAARGSAQRFVSSGGLYALFLLLHHELGGTHHSKLASSLVSLLNLVLDAGLDVQVWGGGGGGDGLGWGCAWWAVLPLSVCAARFSLVGTGRGAVRCGAIWVEQGRCGRPDLTPRSVHFSPPCRSFPVFDRLRRTRCARWAAWRWWWRSSSLWRGRRASPTFTS